MARQFLLAGFAVVIGLVPTIQAEPCRSSRSDSSKASWIATEKKFAAIRDGARSQTTYFYGRDGSSLGKAQQSGATTYFYGRDGSSAGKAQQSDKTTYFYGRDGSSAGKSQASGNTTYFYGRDGSSAGKAQGSGNSAR